MFEVNKHGCEKPIAESLLQKSFDRVWDDIEEDVSKIEEPSLAPAVEPRGMESIVKEILEIVRSLQSDSRTETITKNAISNAISFLKPVAIPGFQSFYVEGGAIKPLYSPNALSTHSGESSDKAEENPKEGQASRENRKI